MTRAFIVVNARLYREGLALLLGDRRELTVVGAEDSRRAALARIDEVAPDVALVDMSIPDLPDFIAALGRRSPRVLVVAIGTNEVDDLVECAHLGVAGFVTTDSSIDEVIAAVQAAASGELICSGRAAGMLMRRLGELAAAGNGNGGPVDGLTRREREVGRLICEDLSNKEIATRMGIEVATVKNHVHNLLGKLHVHRRTDAMRLLAGMALGPASLPADEA